MGMIEGIDQLFLMATTLAHCMPVLFYGFVLIVASQTLVSLFLNNILLTYYLEEGSGDPSSDSKLFEYFGTFSRCMLSMLEATFGNFKSVARVLQEDASEWFVIFAVIHKLLCGFAFMGVINGIFVKETFKAAESDDLVMTVQKMKAQALHTKKMKKFF